MNGGFQPQHHTLPHPGLPGPPGKPAFSDVTDTTMKVSWSPPDVTGGCEIEGYEVEYKPENSSEWQTHGFVPETTATVDCLRRDRVYEFRVKAKNKAGFGKFSNNSEPQRATSLKGVCGGLWWFVVVCGGLWWFVVVCGGLW